MHVLIMTICKVTVRQDTRLCSNFEPKPPFKFAISFVKSGFLMPNHGQTNPVELVQLAGMVVAGGGEQPSCMLISLIILYAAQIATFLQGIENTETKN